MAFKVVPRSGASARRPEGCVTVTAKRINLGRRYHRAIGSPSHVRVEWDADSRVIRLVPSESTDITYRISGNSQAVTVLRFLRTIGWDRVAHRRARAVSIPVAKGKEVVALEIDLKAGPVE